MTSAEASPAAAFVSQVDILDDLERQILDGELTVGQKLASERELCQHYGVSRPVVREALRGLAERGHIETVPNRGSFVRPAQGNDLAQPLARLVRRVGVTLRDIVAARTILECAAARFAAETAGSPEIAEIRRALENHNDATTVRERAETDVVFHEAIMKAAGNPVLEIMYGAIRTFVVGMMMRSQTDGVVRSAGDPLHELILTSIENHDATRAETTMRKHLTLAVDLYGPDIDRALDEVLRAHGVSPAELD